MKRILITLLMTLLIMLSYAIDKQYDIESHPDASTVIKPCLIIAPGNGYHKDLPIITDLAKQANAAGFMTLRFNWSPRDPKATDAQYNEARYADVLRMIDLIRATQYADTANVFIAGKSLGSIFAYNAAMEQKRMRGIVLLTPIFVDDELTAQIYPDLDSLYCPILIVAGDNDSDNAVLPALYRAASTVNTTADVVIVAGDHGLNVDDYNTESGQKRNMENISHANKSIVLWLLRQVKRAPKP